VIIDVYADTICPWCRIGNKHLTDAISHWTGETVTVRHHPFELRPDMPKAGVDFRQQMAAIKGDANIKPMLDRVCQAGEACDLTFRFDNVGLMPNTLLSHQVVQAVPEARQSSLLEAIHVAYFEDGKNIGDRETMLAIAVDAGFERAAIEAKLDDDEFVAEIARRSTWARDQGITGVPFFVFDNAIAVSGAQPAEVLLSAMTKATEAAPAR
jgi:predicted DsbA family dithiol-disulfide isomerase